MPCFRAQAMSCPSTATSGNPVALLGFEGSYSLEQLCTNQHSMNPTYDVVVVGAGLAGACTALYLSSRQRLLVVDTAMPASGASGAAAGLVNPFMGRKAKAVWRKDEALAAFDETLDHAQATHLFRRNGLIRPARNTEQAQVFEQVAQSHAEELTWLPPQTVITHYPYLNAPFGALHVHRGGAVAVPAYVEAVLQQAIAQDAVVASHTRFVGWEEADGQIRVELASAQGTEHVITQYLILTLGYGYTAFPQLAALNVHGVKGQVVRVPRPEALNDVELPFLSGMGYVIAEANTLVLGSSYEHTFTDQRPSPEQSALIIQKTTAMLPALARSPVLSAEAGVRVTVPRTRLPMLGPLPNHRHTWIFTGLGTKGLLMAPLLAQHLPHYLEDPERIPAILRPH